MNRIRPTSLANKNCVISCMAVIDDSIEGSGHCITFALNGYLDGEYFGMDVYRDDVWYVKGCGRRCQESPVTL